MHGHYLMQACFPWMGYSDYVQIEPLAYLSQLYGVRSTFTTQYSRQCAHTDRAYGDVRIQGNNTIYMHD